MRDVAHVSITGTGGALTEADRQQVRQGLPARVFGVLMSIEPAVGALAGLVVLGEALRSREVAAIALVCVASAGAAWADRRAPLD